MLSSLPPKRVLAGKTSQQDGRRTTSKRRRSENARGHQAPNPEPFTSEIPVICLSGFTADEKELYHNLIQKLGGSYTRQLLINKNTHLVAKAPEGDKYEAACAFVRTQPHQGTTTNLQILRVAWLEACGRANQWVPVSADHHFGPLSSKATCIEPSSSDSANALTKRREQELLQVLEQELNDERDPKLSLVFAACRFIILGLELDSSYGMLLRRLIRRGMGTILWDMDDSVTHILIRDGCEENVRETAELIRQEHPRHPSAISPQWIVECWQKQALLAPVQYPPLFVRALSPKVEQKTSREKQTVTVESQTTNKSNLFRGSLFVLFRISPPTNAVDYNSDELEAAIRLHGGLTLNEKIVEALKVDAANHLLMTKDALQQSQQPGSTLPMVKRKCYVLCWGGGYSESRLLLHPQLSQVKQKNLCRVITVTPIWFSTCCTEGKVVAPGRSSPLFEPTPWPIRKFSSKITPKPNVRISLSGLSGSRKAGLIQLIQEMGAEHCPSLSMETTHLICHDATGGQKFQKATEWKIPIVSMDWLFHVAQFGFHGKNRVKGGCEASFAVKTK